MCGKRRPCASQFLLACLAAPNNVGRFVRETSRAGRSLSNTRLLFPSLSLKQRHVCQNSRERPTLVRLNVLRCDRLYVCRLQCGE